MRKLIPIVFFMLISASLGADVSLVGLKGGIANEEPSEISVVVSDRDYSIHVQQFKITLPSDLSIAESTNESGVVSPSVFELTNFDIERAESMVIHLVLNGHAAGSKRITSYLFYIPYTEDENKVRTYYRLNMQPVSESELTADDYWQLGPYHQDVTFLEQECTKNDDCNPLKCIGGNITCVEGHCIYENCETVESVLGRVNWESKTTAIIIISIVAILGIVIIATKK